MKKLVALSAVAGMAVAASAAYGGFVQPAPVDVDLTNLIASGDQVSARYSANAVEFIGCGVRRFQGGVAFGFCQATDAAGDAIICSTSDQYLLDAIESSGDFGFITFSWDAAEQCTRIGFSNQSFYLPKKLDAN